MSQLRIERGKAVELAADALSLGLNALAATRGAFALRIPNSDEYLAAWHTALARLLRVRLVFRLQDSGGRVRKLDSGGGGGPLFRVAATQLQDSGKWAPVVFVTGDEVSLYDGGVVAQPPSLFCPLDAEQAGALSAALRRPAEDVLGTGVASGPYAGLVNRETITVKALDKVRTPDVWLNDEAINRWAAVCWAHALQAGRDVLVFSTHLLTLLAKGGAGNVRRWLRNRVAMRSGVPARDIPFEEAAQTAMAADQWLVPVHLEDHWGVAAVVPSEREVRYYDSMAGVPSVEVDVALRQLVRWAAGVEAEAGTAATTKPAWSSRHVFDKSLQTDCSDCGVFVCLFLSMLADDGVVWVVNAETVRRKKVRQQLAWGLLTGTYMSASACE